MTLVLSLSPAVDVTYELQELKVGESNRVERVTKKIGGKATNVACVLKQLGHEPAILTALGGSVTDWFTTALSSTFHDSTVIPIATETRTSVTVFDGDATVLNEPPAAISAAELEEIKRALSQRLIGEDYLVISGRMPAGVGPNELASLISLANQTRIRVCIDTTGDHLLAAAKAHAWLLKPNEIEAMDAAGTKTADEAAKHLISLGALNVLLSRGEKGISLYRQGIETLEFRQVDRLNGNPTGAGDASLAGFIGAKLDGLSDEIALRHSVAAGSAAVLVESAGEIDLSMFKNLIKPN